MEKWNPKKIPLTGIGSYLVIVIFLGFTLASIISYNGSFSPFNNWLSDLGSSSKNPSGYIYFNIGCILTGIAFIISAIGLVKWKTINRKQNNLILLSQCCGFLTAIALVMVGIFSEDHGIKHYVWASVYFILLLIFLIITSIALKTHIKYIRWIQYYSNLSILINLIFVLISTIGLKVPILEWIAVFSVLIWIGLIGYNTSKLEKHLTVILQ